MKTSGRPGSSPASSTPETSPTCTSGRTPARAAAGNMTLPRCPRTRASCCATGRSASRSSALRATTLTVTPAGRTSGPSPCPTASPTSRTGSLTAIPSICTALKRPMPRATQSDTTTSPSTPSGFRTSRSRPTTGTTRRRTACMRSPRPATSGVLPTSSRPARTALRTRPSGSKTTSTSAA